jgi:hypothetical protein
VDTTNVDAVRPFLNENTLLVLLETPTNPLIKIVDIPSISDLTHELCPRGIVVVDNTMLSPYLQNPLDLGADIVYESGTKYLSGHHDLMAGVLAVKDSSLGEVGPFNKFRFDCRNFILSSTLLVVDFLPSIPGSFFEVSKHWLSAWKDNKPMQVKSPVFSSHTVSRHGIPGYNHIHSTNFIGLWLAAQALY